MNEGKTLVAPCCAMTIYFSTAEESQAPVSREFPVAVVLGYSVAQRPRLARPCAAGSTMRPGCGGGVSTEYCDVIRAR
jgi:hypothetical protein